MKSSVAYIFVIALVGGVMSARLRRQAPAAHDAVAGPDPGAAPDSVEEGAPGGITTPGSGTDVKGVDSAMGFILGDLNNQASMGVPVKPNQVGNLLNMASGMGSVGGQIADPNPKMINDLQTAPPLVGDAAAAAPAGTV